MKARLTDPKCMHLRWRKAIFDNPFTKLKLYPLQSSFELGSFLEITLARITPQIGGKCERHRKKKNLNDWKCPNNTGGIKEISQSSKLPTQSWGMIKKIQKIQKIWASHKNNWGDYAQPNKMKKTKRKSPNPTLGGMIDYFGRTIQKIKGQVTSTSDP